MVKKGRKRGLKVPKYFLIFSKISSYLWTCRTENTPPPAFQDHRFRRNLPFSSAFTVGYIFRQFEAQSCLAVANTRSHNHNYQIISTICYIFLFLPKKYIFPNTVLVECC